MMGTMSVFQSGREKIEKYMSYMSQYYENGRCLKKDIPNPIFEIMVFEHPDKELVYPNGTHSGFPDIGASNVVGFYYNLNDAIEVMQKNVCDIRETVYNAGFIFCKYPGCYNSVGSDGRLYFVWDENRQGFFEAEEPKIFRHIAY